jgi:molybdate transport system permease protein
MLVLFCAAVAALLTVDFLYDRLTFDTFRELLARPQTRFAIRLSLVTSLATLGLVMLVAPPVGYALSRYRFRGRSVVDALVDVPIVLPPVVIGVSLLVFFSTGAGRAMEEGVRALGGSLHGAVGIVLCQFFVSVSYAIRACKAAFDAVDPRLEQLALTLGCSHRRAFRTVTLPLARNGLVAGGVMAWARAVGVFGPLMVFVGTTPMRAEVMPTTIYLELSVGNVEVALAVAIVMIFLAGVALTLTHWLFGSRGWE